ncbi:MAG TPA: glycosyltransferase family 4 protein [Candidatus Saccharimonadia bacterium]|nr:glycosyltransferase family 4 protein [Candidatus Saccharimonadia bacterium]
MNILWFTWKDLKHPEAGGAEIVNEQLARRLAANGHAVKLIVSAYPGCVAEENVSGYEVVRLGNRYTVYLRAWRHYRSHLRDWPDLVIDEINTVPFFAKFYARQPVVLFVHMLCRQIWFYQMVFPLSAIGYIIEPLYLRLLRRQKVITVSASTQHDLERHGFSRDNISVISEGVELVPCAELPEKDCAIEPTILSFGTVRPMKRTLQQLQAYEIAKRQIPQLKLIIAGALDGAYGDKLRRRVGQSPYKADITVLGRVSASKKTELMRQAHVILSTAVKEGWGLTITEAATQGTPAVAYDVDGLRDSIKNGVTGLVTQPNPNALASGIVKLLSDPKAYQTMRNDAWTWSKEVTFDRSYDDFAKVVQNA